MKNVIDELEATIIREELKNSDDKTFKELEILLETMEKLGYLKKPGYTLPMVDTIGKTYYESFNKTIGF